MNNIFSLALQPPFALVSDFQFYDHFTDDRTPWTGDQLVARPLPKQRPTQTQNKHIKNSGALVCQQTIPIERPPLVGEVSAKFSG
jgi:hypothetical protein